jgi:hypothetical protein
MVTKLQVYLASNQALATEGRTNAVAINARMATARSSLGTSVASRKRSVSAYHQSSWTVAATEGVSALG